MLETINLPVIYSLYLRNYCDNKMLKYHNNQNEFGLKITNLTSTLRVNILTILYNIVAISTRQ